MRTFKDCTGQAWDVELTIGTAKRLSSRLAAEGIKFLDARDMMSRLSDIFFAIDCVAILLEDALKARSVTEAEFGSRLRGGSAFEAQRAFIEEYVDFFPDPTISSVLHESLERSLETSKKAQTLVRRAMEQILTQQEEEIETIEKKLADSANISST